MRLRNLLGCFTAGAWLGLTACGGAAKPAASATAAAPKPAGAHAFVESSPGGMDLYIDLAGMRDDKIMAKVIARAEAASPDTKLNSFIRTLDRVDATAVGSGDNSEAVVVMWGHFPADPTTLPLLKPGQTFEAAPPLASGVKAYTHDKGECLFVLSDTLWVMANGSMCATVKEKLTASADPPGIPTDKPLLSAQLGPAFMSSMQGAETVDHADLEIKAGMSSLKGKLSFKEEAAAKEAEVKVRGISALIAMVASSGCKAISNLTVDVARDSNKLSVELKGLSETADAWDPATCPKLGGQPPDPIATADVAKPSAATPAPVPSAKGTKHGPKPAKPTRPKKN